MWQNFGDQINIPPSSVCPCIVQVEPGKLGGGGDVLENIIIQTNVFTTLGQFGKTGYGSSFDDGDSVIANVFLSSVKDSVAPANIMINQTGVLAQVPVTFYATIADFDLDATHDIEAGSRIIINIPRDWTFSSPAPPDTDFIISETTFLGQTQLIGELTVDVVSGVTSLEFVATPPCVETLTMYVMYLLADGKAAESGVTQRVIGALAEIILQVIQNGVCT